MVIEPWSGVTMLSSLFEEQGLTVFGCVEIVPILQELAKWLHQGALVDGDFYAGRWREWKALVPAGCRVHVLTGGVACVTLSSAGKQLAQKDPLSQRYSN